MIEMFENEVKNKEAFCFEIRNKAMTLTWMD